MELVKAWGFDAVGASDGEDALEKIGAEHPDIVLADLVMPRRDGLSLLRALSDQLDTITFLMVTAQGSVESAVNAMKIGAYDYIAKPIDPHRLRVLLEKVVERHDSRREVAALRRELVTDGRLGRIVGKSQAIQKVFALIEQTAPAQASVLVVGESGTGKELVAAAIHELSPRSAAPFVAINCAAIPEGLLESEIFGHERGAFTGAINQRLGCFELAHRGTLLLDEVAEMAPSLQAKLLRVLQERVVRRLGSMRDHPFDVRVVAATNSDPQTAVRDGRLREDLYYRINVVTIDLPPLRERREDIPLLVHAFLPEFATQRATPIRGVAPDAMRALQRYTWPGNVRELRNVVERAIILASGELIETSHLPPDLVGSPSPPNHSSPMISAGMRVDEAERHLIEVTLKSTNNNKTRAAEMLGISVKTLHNKLNKFRTLDAK